MKISQLAFTASLSVFAYSGAAISASADEPKGGERLRVLENIIVTARKVEESIQDTPISVVAFGAEELDKIGVSTPEDISALTPNVYIVKSAGNQNAYGYSIRGISGHDSALAVEPTVGLYVDGVYIARATNAAFDIPDLERIEVLRGPQGTLYGRNTIGGVINIITEKPRGEFAVRQKLSTGNYDAFRTQTIIDTPAMGDFAFKLSYLNDQQGGFYESVYTGGELGQAKAENFRFAGRWTPSETVTVDYSYDRSDRENNSNTSQVGFVRPFQAGLGGAIYAQAAAIARATGRRSELFTTRDDDDDASTTADSHTATIAWNVSPDMLFKSITGYREWEAEVGGVQYGRYPADGATVLNGMGGFVPTGDLVSFFESFSYQSETEQFSQEFQLIGTFLDGKLHYNTGVFYLEETGSLDQPVGANLVLPASFAYGSLPVGTSAFLCNDPTGAGNIDTDGDFIPDFATACLGKDTVLGRPGAFNSINNQSIAVYGAFTYSFTDQLDVTLGLRYTEDEKEAALLFAGSDLSTQRETYSNFSPSFTFDYIFNENLNTYFKITNSYRSGGFNTRASTPETFAIPIDEETILAYELGIKSDWFDNTLRFNAAAFFFQYEDQQITQFVAGASGASSIIVNAGESETLGLEMDITWLPLEGVMIMANYGYLNRDIKSFETPSVNPVTGLTDNAGGNVDISDTAYQGSPATHEGALIMEYEFSPTDYGQLSLRVEGTWVAERFYHPQLNQYDSSEAYHLVNARALLADIPMGSDGRLNISLWGKNLENTEYSNFGIDFGSLGFTTNNFGDPRTYGVDVTYQFNR